MAKCPSCNKFASLGMQDPEVSDLEVDEGGTVTAEVRIVRTSECCGDEIKESTLSLEDQVDVEGHDSDAEGDHTLTVEEVMVEAIEESGSRYAKSYYGAHVSFKVTCSCSKDWAVEGEMSDKIPASQMDELV